MIKIAVPLVNGSFSSHFGGAEAFGFYEIEESTGRLLDSRVEVPPPHERGVFPSWLKEKGTTDVLAGGMGPRAVQMLESFGIRTVLGASGEEPEALVRAYLRGTLVSSGEGCREGGLHGCGHHGSEG